MAASTRCCGRTSPEASCRPRTRMRAVRPGPKGDSSYCSFAQREPEVATDYADYADTFEVIVAVGRTPLVRPCNPRNPWPLPFLVGQSRLLEHNETVVT